MRVIATKRGFYQKIREPGDEFEYPLPKGQDMPSWMKPAPGPKPEPESGPEDDPEVQSEDDELLG